MRSMWAAVLLGLSMVAGATEINLVAIMGNRVMVEIDGSKPKLMVPNESRNEVTLLSISNGEAVFDVAGKKQTLSMNNRSYKALASTQDASGVAGKTIALSVADGGHFFAPLTLNGVPVRGMIDTGATTLAISSSLAKTANVSFAGAATGYAQTAQGIVAARRVKINTLRFGDLLLYNVDATVIEGDFPSAPLIGMNILQRFTMQREADQLLLTQRY